MQRVDASYLYDLGDAIRCLRAFRLRDVEPYEIWQPLINCRQKLNDFLQASVYSGSIRGALRVPADAFIREIDALSFRIANEKLEIVHSLDQAPMQRAYERFEPAFSAELSSQILYLVVPKGVYDVIALVEQGSQLFPQSVHFKAPEASRDIEEGAKALAFELWSSAAFHFHRANEAVLRRYYDHVMEDGKRPRNCTMGTMLAELEKHGKGDPHVRIALKSVKDLHRNPNSHPGDFIDDSEQAFSLVAAIRAVMGYMLDQMPAASLEDMMAANPSSTVNAPPLIDQKQTG